MDAGRLDTQRGTAHGSPGQAGNHANALEGSLLAEGWLAQVALQVCHADTHRLAGFIKQFDDALADDLVQLLFQVPDTGFSGIALNHLTHGSIGDVELLLQQAGPLQQPGQQVMLGSCRGQR